MSDKQYFPLKLATAAFALSMPGLICPPAVWAATFIVSTTSDAGPGSLRQAITDANSNPGNDTIEFLIPGLGPHTIALQSALPTLTDTEGVVIDGYTQPGSTPNTQIAQTTAVIMIDLDGAATTGANGLLINGGSTPRLGDPRFSALRDRAAVIHRERHRRQFHRHQRHRDGCQPERHLRHLYQT